MRLRVLRREQITQVREEAIRSQFIRDETGCLVWTGSCNKKGYGMVGLLGTNYLTHRVMYALHHGEVPALLVCHTCDNPPCGLWSHLFLGTHQDNRDDAIAKGRKIGPSVEEQVRGRTHGGARLTEAEVLAIRAEPRYLGSGDVLADRYGVLKSTISMIRNNKNWRHI